MAEQDSEFNRWRDWQGIVHCYNPTAKPNTLDWGFSLCGASSLYELYSKPTDDRVTCLGCLAA